MSNTYDLWDQKPTTSKFSPAEHAKTIDGRARAKRPEKVSSWFELFFEHFRQKKKIFYFFQQIF